SLEEGLAALEAINKAAARPDLERQAAASRRQLIAQRDTWRRKGEILRQFLPDENPEVLLIIRDDMMADADPAFHLYALEYLNELMRQTINLPPEPVMNITLEYNQRRTLRLLFAAERTMI